MSLKFVGGERIQRGRGLGGLLRMFKSLFSPVLKSVGKNVVRAATSNTAKSIAKTLGEQAIESGLNLATDALRGNNLKESANNEITALKSTAANSLDRIKRKRKSQEGQGIKMGKKMKKSRTVYKVRRKVKRNKKTSKIKKRRVRNGKKKVNKRLLDFLG